MSRRSKSFTRDRADFWRMPMRNMQRLLARRPPPPVDDVEAMLRWYSALDSATQRKLSPTFRNRLTELRIEREAAANAKPVGAPAQPASAPDTDWAAFERDYHPSADDQKTSIASLQKQRAFWRFKLERAERTPPIDEAAVAFATKQFIEFESAIHDAELRAQRLGLDQGDLVPRPEAERVVRSLAYWMMRHVDDVKADVSPKLAAQSARGPLFREEIDAVIEPALLAARLLQPFTRATQIHAANTLPKWAVSALRAGLEDNLETVPPIQS